MAVDSLEHHKISTEQYNHASFDRRRRFLRFLLRQIGFRALAKLDRIDGIENVPPDGPALLMINHIAFIDPIVVLTFLPRLLVPMAKAEVYDYPVIGIFPKLYGVIPVRREEVDRRAIQQALQVLHAGELVLVAPEGTRSPQLQQGKEGVAYLASRSQAPIIPIAVDGTEGFPALRGSPSWKTPGARLAFGPPFRFKAEYRRAGREDLRKMTDEALYILAAMLAPERRGFYSDLTRATQDTIEWA
jgi:1-acyl-sn-glycerol-3-phosphate acyltransferase